MHAYSQQGKAAECNNLTKRPCDSEKQLLGILQPPLPSDKLDTSDRDGRQQTKA